MRLKRKRSRRPDAVLVVPGMLAVSALAGTYLVRRRSRAKAGAGEHQWQEWSCACGQEFRIAGEGRHRVFWIIDAAVEDPVLGHRCPSCDRDLAAQD